MIIEYHRPKSMAEALELLARTDVVVKPLGGGSALTRPTPEQFAAIDLQSLGLNTIHDRGNFLDLGAMLTLGALLQTPGMQPALDRAIHHEATYNLRQVATIAGTLVASEGRSPFTTVLLAADARLKLHPGDEEIDLGDLLPVRSTRLIGRLITQVTIPLNARLAYKYAARTPADFPLVCAAVAQWPSGRTRVALGGHGSAPSLVFDGTESEGAVIAAGEAYSTAGDQWASAEYRKMVAGRLVERCLQEVRSQSDA